MGLLHWQLFAQRRPNRVGSATKEKQSNRAVLALLAITRLSEWLSVAVLFSMMSLTGVDVVARYLFNRPISGAFELVEVMLTLLVFLAFPASIRFDSHIKVELINSFGSLKADRLILFAAPLAGIAIFSLLTFQLYTHAGKLKSYGQVTNSLEIPLYLIAFLASACCLICCFLLLRQVASLTGDKT